MGFQFHGECLSIWRKLSCPAQSGPPALLLASPSPQSLISSSGSTTSPGPIEPPATRTWCFTIRKALILRPEAPRLSAGPSLRRPGRGASLPANPYSFVRKHHAYRLGPPAPLLASPSPQSLNSSSGHANQARNFPVRRRPCWRRPPRKTLTLRRATPTRSGLSRSTGASVGVALPEKP